jgi:hypothetical protein
VEHGTAGHNVDTDSADSQHETLVASAIGTSVRGLPSPPTAEPDALLTAEEVGRALGFTVVRESHSLPGPLARTDFRTADRKRSVLLLQIMEGPLASMAWRSNSRGQLVSGIGDGAYLTGNRGIARKGDIIVLITLAGKGKRRGDQLGELMRHAVTRLPAPNGHGADGTES